jgi:prevent-host-death family protein
MGALSTALYVTIIVMYADQEVHIMRTAAIAKLKAGLSGYLDSVKAGEQVVVTDRGRPVALIVPIDPNISEDTRRAELVAKGLVRPSRGPISLELITGAAVSGVAVERALQAVMEDREDRI